MFPERKYSETLGPGPQTDLARKTHTPTGRPIAQPESLNEMFSDENIERIKGLVQKGMEKGGHKWYWTGGILDAFVEHLGPEEGLRRFNRFMELGAAVSPRSNVATELKRASVLMNRELEGLPIAPLTPDMFPEGYGHMATRTAHSPAIERLVETGSVGDPAVQPKIPSYAENKKGNYLPVTADTHNYQIWSGQKKSPSVNEYPFLEAKQKELAAEMGLDPAEFQSALWVGAGDITGVEDTRNLTAALNQRIAKSAEEYGISEAEATKRFVTQGMILRALMGGVGTGALASGMISEEEPEML